MPRLLSPEEALSRVSRQPRNTEPAETIGCRVSGNVFRRVAEYGIEKGAKDMSTALRWILDEWYQMKMLKGGVGLAGFETEDLAAELRRRGLIAVNQSELVKRFRETLKRAQRKILRVMERLQTERF